MSSGNVYKKRQIVSSDELFRRLFEQHQATDERNRREEERKYRRYHPEEFEGEEEAGEEESDGFSPGIEAEMIDPNDVSHYAETEEERQERLRQEAEAAVAEAYQEAERIVQEAQQQAEQIRQEAEEQGYLDGTARGEEEAGKVLAQRMEELNERQDELEQQYQEAFAVMEPELVDVICQVFERVFHIQFDDKKEIVSYLVIHTIQNVEGSKDFKIKASPDNYPYLSDHLEELRSEVGEDCTLEVVSDNTLGEDRCVIETDAGYFDCSLSVHLESLVKDLRSIARGQDV